MGRRPRNKLPTAHVLLTPMAHDTVKVRHLLDKTKHTQKFYYDSKRAGKPCIVLQPGDEEWLHILEATNGRLEL